jgi:hypothetical protein
MLLSALVNPQAPTAPSFISTNWTINGPLSCSAGCLRCGSTVLRRIMKISTANRVPEPKNVPFPPVGREAAVVAGDDFATGRQPDTFMP